MFLPVANRSAAAERARRAITAQTRFGWGATPGIAKRIAGDPVAWVEAQIERGAPPLPPGPTGQEAFLAATSISRARFAKDADEARRRRRALNALGRREGANRLAVAVRTDRPFADRWAAFWSNHFAIATRGGPMIAMGGAFEREAIRPHAFGRFADMLGAVAMHPAMLIYLDNANSFGPNSRVGQRTGRGVNENYAREVLELHTLGVDGGYTQDDVEELALALTGWTVHRTPRRRPPEPEEGTFRFHRAAHEPGVRTLLGETYGERGRAQGAAMLADLARHPATARHVARKLAQHFVTDDPPPTLTDRLAIAFQETDGDLASVARALVRAPEAWKAPTKRFLPPIDFLVAAERALPASLPPERLWNAARSMGQPLWEPLSPAGYGQGGGEWFGPEGLGLRLAHANLLADRTDPGADVPAHAEALYGAAIDGRLMEALRRAEAARQGFTLLLMSPQFLRR